MNSNDQVEDTTC